MLRRRQHRPAAFCLYLYLSRVFTLIVPSHGCCAGFRPRYMCCCFFGADTSDRIRGTLTNQRIIKKTSKFICSGNHYYPTVCWPPCILNIQNVPRQFPFQRALKWYATQSKNPCEITVSLYPTTNCCQKSMYCLSTLYCRFHFVPVFLSLNDQVLSSPFNLSPSLWLATLCDLHGCFGRWVPWAVQQQREVHSGPSRVALHLPIRMERARMWCCHGDLLLRWKGQREG
jgi:hypothetical protein